MTSTRVSAAASALLLLAALPASAQREAEVHRGTLQITVHVQGTVVATDMIRLKSQIEGRVEDLDVSTYTWVEDEKPMGFIANKEMAAILDSHTTTVKGVVESRWRKMYRPAPINCPHDCFVMRVFTKNKEQLKPRALLVEAAQTLQLVGRVRPEDAAYVRDDQVLEFWPVKDPARKQKARVTRYVLDIQGERVEPGGSFAIDLSPKRYLDPGTEWEGVIVPLVKRNVLMVPTAAVIEKDGQSYVAVRVSTGITTREFTEITAGVQDKRPILVLDDSQLKAMDRHTPQLDEAAFQLRLREEAARRARNEAEAREAIERERERAASGAPITPASSPMPANAVPQDPGLVPTQPRQRRLKWGQLADPDATFSETPDAE
jgi:hypothetical protein